MVAGPVSGRMSWVKEGDFANRSSHRRPFMWSRRQTNFKLRRVFYFSFRNSVRSISFDHGYQSLFSLSAFLHAHIAFMNTSSWVRECARALFVEQNDPASSLYTRAGSDCVMVFQQLTLSSNRFDILWRNSASKLARCVVGSM